MQPHRAYFGQKDYQQFLLISMLVNAMHFNLELVLCPIVREPGGLAMSSRNRRLTREQREKATCLYHALEKARAAILNGVEDANKITEMIANTIINAGADLDYAIVADPETLDDVQKVDRKVVLAVAAVVDGVRLIDNFIVEPTESN
ncbi:MAG: pantoate--beta-alanine ligase [Planctomycetota bacterium]|nr:pantoate--beta-alanine ligase [Planctomycetota bacterium]